MVINVEVNEVIKTFMQKNPSKRSKSRPYFNHSITFKQQFTESERAKALENVGLNVFYCPSEMVTGCDLLSDSGTTTMADQQWASLIMGDEAYGSNKGYFLLMAQIKKIFGENYCQNPESFNPNGFIFHQGRAAESALFTALKNYVGGTTILSNGHFDTTLGNILDNGYKPVNLFLKSVPNEKISSVFHGNMNVEALENKLESGKDTIPIVFLTITNNTGGGQPISLHNIKSVKKICKKYNVPLFFDACRFAENAWFIKNNELEYKDKSIIEITQEAFSYADGFTISFKKDGMCNMGGGLFFNGQGLLLKKYPHLPEKIIEHQVIKEGHPTYGGMSGRDIMALVSGLQFVVGETYLEHRISQVRKLGETMESMGIPVVKPFGGHAIYIDMNKFFEGTDLKKNEFGGISFTAILLAKFGHRVCELGDFAFGTYDSETGKETFAEKNYVRLAIPRLRYEDSDLYSVAEDIKFIYENKNLIPGVVVTYGKELNLRHFKAQFKFKSIHT